MRCDRPSATLIRSTFVDVPHHMIKVSQLLRGFSVDCRRMSIAAACVRVARTASLLAIPQRDSRLEVNVALRRHIDAVAPSDAYFFVSHRHYLLQGLSRRQRVAMARYHYQHEVYRFVPRYIDAAYSPGGLTLWRARVRDTDFRLRLVPGSDVLNEGGMSVELCVDGQRVAVMSYVYADRDFVFDGVERDRSGGRTTMLLTRKQLSANHGYQAVFNPAFDRCMAAHFCFAAITGIAVAHGFGTVAAVHHRVQPSYTPERHNRFGNAYSRFWESLAGGPRGRFAYEVPVPMILPPLASLRSKVRRRAIRRRAHLETVLHDTCDVIQRYIRWPDDSLSSAQTISRVMPLRK